jgi:L-serine dehydratase
MTLSVFDLFKIGIGPSSSHTVGPMVAARRFLNLLQDRNKIESVARIQVDLFGSLAMTGKGHCTDNAILLGLLGEKPDQIDPDKIDTAISDVESTHSLRLGGVFPIQFNRDDDLIFNKGASLSLHPNGIIFRAFNNQGRALEKECYFSVGGGFVLSEAEINASPTASPDSGVPYPFDSSVQLLELGEKHQLSIPELVLANELVHLSQAEVTEGLLQIWLVMEESIKRGCTTQGSLPGDLGISRRAYDLHKELMTRAASGDPDPLAIMDWVDMFAIAVNEENAAGSRVVTAPTNGAAGVIPAVLSYYLRFVHTAGKGTIKLAVQDFLLTAGAIGMLFKRNASISAAEVGCQGEIGVACSMAAAGLTSIMGGNNQQIENAAEIGMEHNLGLTCDPIGGLVQIPCIERNTMGAIKAINASRLALRGDGKHFVSLDQVIATMKQTGLDMRSKYKETSEGGLAVNVVAC